MMLERIEELPMLGHLVFLSEEADLQPQGIRLGASCGGMSLLVPFSYLWYPGGRGLCPPAGKKRTVPE